MEARFVVVGSGYAGTMAAVRLAGLARAPGAVTLVDPRGVLVERIRLHEAVVRDREVEWPLDALCAAAGITQVRAKVVGLDGRCLLLEGGGTLRFERAILALGSRAASVIPGAAAHALALDPASVARIRSRVGDARRIAVLGGGLTGIELASELAEAGHPVALVLGTLGAALSPRGRAHAHRVLGRLGVELHLGASIACVEADRVHTARGAVPCDLVLDAAGFVGTAPAWLEGARDREGRVRVDASLQLAGRPDVLLAGDCAAPPFPIAQSCQSAMPMGAYAADATWAAAEGRPFRPFAFQRQGLCVSLGRREAVVEWSGRVLTGRTAVMVKEGICRYTVAAMGWQRRGLDYRWRKRASLELPASAEQARA